MSVKATVKRSLGIAILGPQLVKRRRDPSLRGQKQGRKRDKVKSVTKAVRGEMLEKDMLEKEVVME
jgi:hypothetical protein